MSVFSELDTLPPDALFGVNSACQADESEDKINLTVGAYRDDDGRPFVLKSVKQAKEIIVKDPEANHEYLPLTGLRSFNELTAKVLLGEDVSASVLSRVHSIQGLGGTGCLRLGIEFLKRAYFPRYPNAKFFIPKTTWPNHLNLLRHADVPFEVYSYLTQDGLALDFPGLLGDLKRCPPGSVVLLHMVAHNPSGCDPTREEWQSILQVVQEKNLFPFFDNAYQGFSQNLEDDAYSVRLFASAGVEMLVACSYSKNFGLYGERVGSLHVFSADVTKGPALISHLSSLSRGLHSNCPSFGAKIVATILSRPDLKALWKEECCFMSSRLNSIRAKLYQLLVSHEAPGNWDHVLHQTGMFSLTGLSAEAIERLRSRHHVYMASSGRISLAGLNSHNVLQFVRAVVETLVFLKGGGKALSQD